MDILDFPGHWPFNNYLNLVRSHSKSTRRHDIAKILNHVHTPFAFFGISKQIVFVESFKNFLDVFLMGLRVVGVDENIIKVDNNMNIDEILEDIINELRPSHRALVSPNGMTFHS